MVFFTGFFWMYFLSVVQRILTSQKVNFETKPLCHLIMLISKINPAKWPTIQRALPGTYGADKLHFSGQLHQYYMVYKGDQAFYGPVITNRTFSFV